MQARTLRALKGREDAMPSYVYGQDICRGECLIAHSLDGEERGWGGRVPPPVREGGARDECVVEGVMVGMKVVK